jgi:hypothetical protein
MIYSPGQTRQADRGSSPTLPGTRSIGHVALGATTLYALYAEPVAGREYGWTEAGKASAARHGVTEAEAVEAL